MTSTTQNQRYALQELEKEALMGAEGEETFAREVRCIDLSNFAARKNDIAEQLWEAAVDSHPGSKRVVSDNPASDGRALAQRSGVASIPADDARV